MPLFYELHCYNFLVDLLTHKNSIIIFVPHTSKVFGLMWSLSLIRHMHSNRTYMAWLVIKNEPQKHV
jgi:hypothetical protein